MAFLISAMMSPSAAKSSSHSQVVSNLNRICLFIISMWKRRSATDAAMFLHSKSSPNRPGRSQATLMRARRHRQTEANNSIGCSINRSQRYMRNETSVFESNLDKSLCHNRTQTDRKSPQIHSQPIKKQSKVSPNELQPFLWLLSQWRKVKMLVTLSWGWIMEIDIPDYIESRHSAIEVWSDYGIMWVELYYGQKESKVFSRALHYSIRQQEGAHSDQGNHLHHSCPMKLQPSDMPCTGW